MAKKINNKVLRDVPTHIDFYIRKNPNKLSVEQLAEETDLTTVLVERILEDEKVLAEKEQKRIDAQKKKERVKKDNPYIDALGRKERNGEFVATAMTKASAEIADSNRASYKKKKNDTRFIHKPKD